MGQRDVRQEGMEVLAFKAHLHFKYPLAASGGQDFCRARRQAPQVAM